MMLIRQQVKLVLLFIINYLLYIRYFIYLIQVLLLLYPQIHIHAILLRSNDCAHLIIIQLEKLGLLQQVLRVSEYDFHSASKEVKFKK